MKEKITKKQRLQLVGLMTLARDYATKTGECEKAMADIVGIEGEYADQLSDGIYETKSVDYILKIMGIKVK